MASVRHELRDPVPGVPRDTTADGAEDGLQVPGQPVRVLENMILKDASVRIHPCNGQETRQPRRLHVLSI